MPDDYSMHEVVDRAHCMERMWEELIWSHESVESDEELKERALCVLNEIYWFYQHVADKHLSNGEQANG